MMASLRFKMLSDFIAGQKVGELEPETNAVQQQLPSLWAEI